MQQNLVQQNTGFVWRGMVMANMLWAGAALGAISGCTSDTNNITDTVLVANDPNKRMIDMSGQPNFYQAAVNQPNPVIFRATAPDIYEAMIKAKVLDTTDKASIKASARPYVALLESELCGYQGSREVSPVIQYDSRAYTIIISCTNFIDPTAIFDLMK